MSNSGRPLSYWERLRAALFPDRCLLCGSAAALGENYCAGCQGSSPFSPSVRRLEAHVPGGRSFLCMAPFSYENEIRTSLHRMKFRHSFGFLRPFAREMEAALPSSISFDFITFVPMTREKERSRGYNQSALLARELGRCRELPVREVLAKRKSSQEQHLLSAAGRQRNVKGLYRVIEEVTGASILLVDDIVTSGATLEECAGQLYRGGAALVYGICAANAERH